MMVARANRLFTLSGKKLFIIPGSAGVRPASAGGENLDQTRINLRHRSRRSLGLALVCGLALSVSTRGTQDAIANGDTRTITIQHMHTKEVLTVTFKRWGTFDSAALEKLNWHLRDWRRDEPKRMNPRLFDLLWEVHRESGSGGNINVVSAYRSPETNAMLRRRSRAVAKSSQHMQGNALDFYIRGQSMGQVREVAMRMQRGGVGYYPTANTPFVHLDVGSVRSWPRMGRDQLARLFPDGKTVHLPAGGGTMPGYDLAYAEIVARGGSVGGHAGDESEESVGGGGGFFALLFGGGRGGGTYGTGSASQIGDDDGGARAFALTGGLVQPQPTAVASANTIRGRNGRGRRGAEETQVASAAVAKPEPFIPVSAPAPVVEAPIPVRSQPVPVPAPVQAAPVDAQKQLEAAIETQKQAKQTFANLPLPPRRPRDLAQIIALAANEVAHPLPPRRPGDLVQVASADASAADTGGKAKPGEDAVAALNRKAGAASPPVLAFAPVQHPLPPVRTDGQRAANTPVVSVASAKPAAKQDPKLPPVIAVAKTRVQNGSLAALMTAASKGDVVSVFRQNEAAGPAVGKFSNNTR